MSTVVVRSAAAAPAREVACCAPGGTILTDESGAQLGPWALERAFRAARARVRQCVGCGTVQAQTYAAFKCASCDSDKSTDGLPAGFRYHDLRHYFASLLIASGTDVKTVQTRLRHASAKTTLDTYGHLLPDRDESTRAAVESVFQDHADCRRTAEADQ